MEAEVLAPAFEKPWFLLKEPLTMNILYFLQYRWFVHLQPLINYYLTINRPKSPYKPRIILNPKQANIIEGKVKSILIVKEFIFITLGLKIIESSWVHTAQIANILALEGSLQLSNSHWIAKTKALLAFDRNGLHIYALAKRAVHGSCQPLTNAFFVEGMMTV